MARTTAKDASSGAASTTTPRTTKKRSSTTATASSRAAAARTKSTGSTATRSRAAADVTDVAEAAAAKPATEAATPAATKSSPKKKAPARKKKSTKATGAARTLHEMPIAEVWLEYKRSPTSAIRNFLIENYLEIVRFTAERMHTRLPGEVDVDDLISAGLFGLMDAIEAFDLERGVKFETYCAQRIRGAIFDELRAMDWVPRLVRSRTAKVERARKALEMELGRKPTDAELSQRLNVDSSEFQKLTKDSRPVGVVSLNRKWFETDSSKDVREIDVIKDSKQDNPLNEIQRKDLKLLITKGLSRAERLIVILYYYEEMTMKEIGITLDLSESRVSQMHSSILARLKAQMQHRAKEF